MAEPIVIHAETCNGDTYEIRYYRASDYDALAAEVASLRSRLAEAERLLQEVYDGRQSLMSVGLVYRIGHTLNHRPADSASVCPFQGPGKSGYTPTLCPVCNNDFRKCAEIRAADQPGVTNGD